MHAPKLTHNKMNESAEQAALVASLVEEVKATAPVPDDTLQESFVKPYIENGHNGSLLSRLIHLALCELRGRA